VLILYAVADRQLPSPLPEGACGEPLVQLDADGVVGIAGAVESLPEPSEQAVIAHASVVEALAELADPLLPARYGSAHTTPEALGEALQEAHEPLAAALREVEGCVELGVRGVPPTREQADPSRTGREYLERLRADAQLVQRVHRPLAERARAARLERDKAFAASYLVPRDAVDAFVGAVRDRAEDEPELGLVCSGPWPPYSFAGAGA
jgi:hypothetical protein